MKISVKQLKQLIRESASGLSNDTIYSVVDGFVEEISRSWLESYDNVSLSRYARRHDGLTWNKQVEEAAEELKIKLVKVVNEIDTKLTNGDYL